MLWAVTEPARLLAYDHGALGCSVISSVTAYGTGTAAARFWEGDGFLLRRQDETATLCGTVLPESAEELREFLFYIGVQNLLAEPDNLKRLGFSPASEGVEMELCRPIPCPPLPAGFRMRLAGPVASPAAMRLADMYALLCACTRPGFSIPAFEPFYLDMSHRVRHGAVLAAGLYQNVRLYSCAAEALSPKQALLFAGAAAPEVRGRGAFAAVLAALVKQADVRRVLLLCGSQLQPHYEQMGFSACGMCQKACLK